MNITFDNVKFKYVERFLLDGASFSIEDGDKVGVVGVNGTGKSTLLKLITKELLPISGSITISGGTRINYLEQNPIFDPKKTLKEIVLEESTKEYPIEEYEAVSMLSKMGFNDPNITTLNFSGGQLKRVALAKVLVTKCDVLILDEPTNHLDNDIISFLEKFLIKFKHALIMVTHDRYFLERICNKMLELDHGKCYTYQANYTNFLELKAERLEKEFVYEKKLKSILKKEKEWINRGVEARRTKQKYRIKKFEEMSQIKFNESKEMTLDSLDVRIGKKLISLKNASKSFGDNKLFDNFNFELNRDDIIGVVGDNGSGKTTLFKILMGQEELTSGELILGETLKIGYFSQHMELIDPEIRVIDYIKEERNLIETLEGTIDAKTLLERFLFDSNLQYSKVKTLSGGEKRRLQLVRVLSSNPNLLLFDEPTNDLDIYTLEILEDYLLSFKGPILVISHDRYFLDKICNRLLIFDNKNIKESLKSFSEYLEQNNNDYKEIDNQKNLSYKEEKELKKKNKFPSKLLNELNDLEKEIPILEEKLNELKNDNSISPTDFEALMRHQEEIDNMSNDIDIKTTRYLELLEMKEGSL